MTKYKIYQERNNDRAIIINFETKEMKLLILNYPREWQNEFQMFDWLATEWSKEIEIMEWYE